MNWSDLGLGGGIVVVVLAFLVFLKGERADRKETRDSFLKTIQNHINHNTDVVKALHDWLRGRAGDDR